MNFVRTLVIFCIAVAYRGGDCTADDGPCNCNHRFFGSPKVSDDPPQDWKMPPQALAVLKKAVHSDLLTDKQYLWCPNTQSALTYAVGTGYRFVVCPFTWKRFAPQRVSHGDIKKRIATFDLMERVLDSTDVLMGGVVIRITAADPATMMGGSGASNVE
ncbi:hypothetical protein FYK55_26850 [Roseiconus nitratireducens]|uniref:Uncharacterized protein n=1 Tax=Roseiconus nitratireducens TaxID=2605748 RepID=A0A5M6CTU0_9BACT|nr:hypothetical protein [Roseiconus nitratireducens]KAA5538634.1 hypothetical protein FYK55_26850 [Roseiconus nitratireducens]